MNVLAGGPPTTRPGIRVATDTKSPGFQLSRTQRRPIPATLRSLDTDPNPDTTT